jgi:tetratricopeptide (TPR) repeat protein
MAPVVSGTVTVNRLEIPAEARDSFRAACSSVIKKELSDAQRDLNRAVQSLTRFSAAWVLLGQIQRDDKEIELAQQSCMEAHKVDPTYIPAYLCLADLAALQENWTRTAELTRQVIELHPVRAPGAYYLNALASFYIGQMPQAEENALEALKEGGSEQKAPLHWLLAKIYEAKGDRFEEAAQLREYLKLAPHAPGAPLARKILQEIKSERTTPASTTNKPPG